MRSIKIRNINQWEKIKKEELIESKMVVKPIEIESTSDDGKTLEWWSNRNVIQLDDMVRSTTLKPQNTWFKKSAGGSTSLKLDDEL